MRIDRRKLAELICHLISNEKGEVFLTVSVFPQLDSSKGRIVVYKISQSGEHLWGRRGIRVSTRSDRIWQASSALTDEQRLWLLWPESGEGESARMKVALLAASSGQRLTRRGGTLVAESLGHYDSPWLAYSPRVGRVLGAWNAFDLSGRKGNVEGFLSD